MYRFSGFVKTNSIWCKMTTRVFYFLKGLYPKLKHSNDFNLVRKRKIRKQLCNRLQKASKAAVNPVSLVCPLTHCTESGRAEQSKSITNTLNRELVPPAYHHTKSKYQHVISALQTKNKSHLRQSGMPDFASEHTNQQPRIGKAFILR